MICETFNISKNVGVSLLSGMIELTNGMKIVSFLGVSKLNLCLTSFLLGFGGVSVLLQVYSIIYKENISIKPYFYGKLLQGIISAVIIAFIY